MRWVVWHNDGFNYRHLSYTLRVDAGLAELDARWLLVAPAPASHQYRDRFAIDEGPVVRALPAVRGLPEKCGLDADDVDSGFLFVEADGERFVRHLTGAVLSPEPPGMEVFRALFEWAEGLVLACLPPAVAPVWGVNVGIEAFGRLRHLPEAGPPDPA